MIRILSLLVCLTAFLLPGPRLAAITIELIPSASAVEVGDTVTLTARIDYDGYTPATLFSYGLQLIPASSSGFEVTSIAVPGTLDFIGFDSGAQIDSAPTVLGAKGNIEFLQPPYAGADLITWTVRIDAVGTHDFSTAIWRTLGEAEDVFLDGDGSSIDSQITTFESTEITADEIDLDAFGLAITDISGSQVTLTFTPQPGLDHTVEFSTTLQSGIWTPLPGAPHNSGTVTDDVGTDTERFYRLSVVPAGHLNAFGLAITDISGSQVTLTFTPQPGLDHTVEFSTTLQSGIWTPLPGAPHNSGTVTDDVGTDTERFYRLSVVPAGL